MITPVEIGNRRGDGDTTDRVRGKRMARNEVYDMQSGEIGPMTATKQNATLSGPLLLPDVEEMPLRPAGGAWTAAALYGASALAAAYCGFKNVPDHLRGYWQHGWSASYRLPLPPALIVDERGSIGRVLLGRHQG